LQFRASGIDEKELLSQTAAVQRQPLTQSVLHLIDLKENNSHPYAIRMRNAIKHRNVRIAEDKKTTATESAAAAVNTPLLDVAIEMKSLVADTKNTTTKSIFDTVFPRGEKELNLDPQAEQKPLSFDQNMMRCSKSFMRLYAIAAPAALWIAGEYSPNIYGNFNNSLNILSISLIFRALNDLWLGYQ
jgi:hypothetical protein